MTHFLARLVERARGTAPRVEPIIAPRFAPVPVTEIATETEGVPRPNGEKITAPPNNPAPLPAAVREDELVPARGEATEPRVEVVPETLLVPAEIPETPTPLIVRPTKIAERDAPSVRAPAILPARARSRALARPSLRSQSIRITPRSTLPNERPAEPPIVRVTIGRIEVRAAPAPAAAPRQTAPTSGPKLTLDAYLKSRREGAR
jgi:hypothetical protein